MPVDLGIIKYNETPNASDSQVLCAPVDALEVYVIVTQSERGDWRVSVDDCEVGSEYRTKNDACMAGLGHLIQWAVDTASLEGEAAQYDSVLIVRCKDWLNNLAERLKGGA